MPELTWQGKYDAVGRRVRPDHTPFPLHTVEYAGELDTPGGWRNRLIQGPSEAVLPALLPEFAGQVRLVYIDPPFATGNAFTMSPLPGLPDAVTRSAYRDDADLDRYLAWFAATATLLRELLAADGALVVHCDWRANSAIRLVLDEVFGVANLRNEIVWAYRSGGASRREALARKHDTLLLYARSPRFRVRPVTERQYLRKPFMGSKQDEDGRYYVDTLLRDVLEGELTCVEDGETIVRYNVRPVLNLSRERLDYPTQKPLGLLKLLCRIASDPGDLVLDCCCGSGTTALAAEELCRRWVAADASPFAIQTVRKRLLALPAAAPFAMQRVTGQRGDAPSDAASEAPARIGIEAAVSGRTVTLTVTAYHPNEQPSGAIHWYDCIDSWVVDWSSSGGALRVESYTARNPRGSGMPVLSLAHTYEVPGRYRIVCRVVDILARETVHSLEVAIE